MRVEIGAYAWDASGHRSNRLMRPHSPGHLGCRSRFAVFAMLALCVGSVAPATVGCSRAVPATPESVLTDWVSAMQASRTDATTRRRAFELLSSASRAALVERAQRASQLSGREIPPYELLAPGRFAMRFQFDPARLSSVIDGDHATVVARSATGDRADVPMVREGGQWRVALRIPAVEPYRSPADGGPRDEPDAAAP